MVLQMVLFGVTEITTHCFICRCQWHFLSTTAAKTESGQKSEEKTPQEEKPAEAGTQAEDVFKEEREKLTSSIAELQVES